MPNSGFTPDSGNSVIGHNKSAQKATFRIVIVQPRAAMCWPV